MEVNLSAQVLLKHTLAGFHAPNCTQTVLTHPKYISDIPLKNWACVTYSDQGPFTANPRHGHAGFLTLCCPTLSAHAEPISQGHCQK